MEAKAAVTLETRRRQVRARAVGNELGKQPGLAALKQIFEDQANRQGRLAAVVIFVMPVAGPARDMSREGESLQGTHHVASTQVA